ncbi:putative autophagy-related protein [Chloropicon primus]|nr:putative autophagy-related protein [Chloropicon primus]
MISRVLQEWVLKRLYRMVLKPVLGKLLSSDLDLAQLDVQFLNGTVELRDLHLNAAYISEHFSKYGLELEEGYIGHARAEIPYYALSSSQIVLCADTIKLKLVPCDKASEEGEESCSSSSGDAKLFEDAASSVDAGEEEEEEDELWASSSDEEGGGSSSLRRRKSVIMSSIEMVAGGLEDFLQKLKIVCSNVEIELAVCSEEEESIRAKARLGVSLKQLSYETKVWDAESDRAAGEATSSSSAPSSRQITFSGLSVAVGIPAAEAVGDPSGSEEEFHDAIGTPTSASGEEAMAAASGGKSVKLLGSEEGEGLDGFVSIRELRGGDDGEGKTHTSIDVQLGSPVVYIRPNSIEGCIRITNEFSRKTASVEVVADPEGGTSGANEGLQKDMVDSVLFPDCKSIAADILPTLIAKSGDDDLGDAPPEALALASSVEEFFDANSRLTASLSASAYGGAQKVFSTVMKVQQEDKVGEDKRRKNELDMVLHLHIDHVSLDLPFEEYCSHRSKEGTGMFLRLSGLEVVKQKYVSDMEVDVNVAYFGVSCYGAPPPEDSKPAERAMVSGLPNGSTFGENGARITPSIHGRRHLVLTSSFDSGTRTEVQYKPHSMEEDEVGKSSRRGLVQVLLQPFWVMLDDGTLGMLVPKALEWVASIQRVVPNGRNEGAVGAGAGPAKGSKGQAPPFVSLNSEHVRIMGLAPREESGGAKDAMIVDIVNRNVNEKMLSVDCASHIEVEAKLSEVSLSLLPDVGRASNIHRVLHMHESSSAGKSSSSTFRILTVLRGKNESDEEEMCSSAWEYLNERFADDATSTLPRRAKAEDESLKDFYLQERAMSKSQTFVHLSCNEVRARLSVEDCCFLTRFLGAYSSILPPGDGGETKSEPKGNFSMLLETSITLEAQSRSSSDGKDPRLYGVTLDGLRLFGSHSNTFNHSMIHLGAHEVVAFSRMASDTTAIVQVHSKPEEGPCLQVSCAAKKGEKDLNKVVVLLVDVKDVSATVPNFLLEEDVTVIDDVCSMFSDSPAEETPVSLKLACRTSNACLALNTPPVHNALEDLSLSRTEVNVSVAASLNFETQSFQLALHDPSLSLQFRESPGESTTVFQDTEILFHVTTDDDEGKCVKVINEEVTVLLNEDSLTGTFQLAEYLLEHTKKYFKSEAGKGRGSSAAEGRDVAAYRKLKMERLRLEQKLSMGPDTPWVIIDDALRPRKDSDDSMSDFTDVEIEGHSCMYSSEEVAVIDDYIPVPEVYEDESLNDEELFASQGFQKSFGHYPAPRFQLISKVKALNVLFEASKTAVAERDGSEEERREPSVYQIQCKLGDSTFQYSVFGGGEDYAWRTTAAIKTMSVKESFENKSTYALHLWETVQHPIEDNSFALSAAVDLARPEPANHLEDEMNVKLTILPLRVRLNPNLVHYFADFAAKLSSKLANFVESEEEYYDIVSETAPDTVTYVKTCDVSSLRLRLDYTPQRSYFAPQFQSRRVLIDLLNLVPLHGVELSMKTVHSKDMLGLGACVEQVLGEWLEHVAKYQAGEFVVGIKPLKSICKVGAGAKKLITLPMKEFREGGAITHGLKKGASSFLHALSLEILQLGANIAGLLDGDEEGADRDQPADIRQGLKQASSRLSSGMLAAAELVGAGQTSKAADLKAVAGATFRSTAGAIKCTLLGARNSLDPERFQNQKKEQQVDLSS